MSKDFLVIISMNYKSIKLIRKIVVWNITNVSLDLFSDEKQKKASYKKDIKC